MRGDDFLIGACASPGGSTAFHFHWIQRAELTNVPSFSAKFAAGSMKTSVCTSSVFRSTSARMSGRQNEAVSCSKFSATTSHFSFDEGGNRLARVRPVADRVHAEAEEPFDLAAVHVVEDVGPAPVLVRARRVSGSLGWQA